MTVRLADEAWDAGALERELDALRARLSLRGEKARAIGQAVASLVEVLEVTRGETRQQRWTTIEAQRWPRWEAGQDRLVPVKRWTWGPAALVLSRSVRPGWALLSRAAVAVVRLAARR